MRVNLPVYIETSKSKGNQATLYTCRPLFHHKGNLQRTHEELSQALNRLSRDLRLELEALAKDQRHEAFSSALYYPQLKEHRLEICVDLKSQPVKGKFLLLSFRAAGRRIALSPKFPKLYFEYHEQRSLGPRAQEAFSYYFRQLEKDGKHVVADLKEAMLHGQAWVNALELEISVRQESRRQQEKKFAALFDSAKMDGQQELRRVGHCLDWLYPDELQRASLRDTEVERLRELLAAKERRPILLVGPPKVGKTAILHETVYRRVQHRKHAQSTKGNIWLLAPQRLISGMSFVGQWENRLLAILKHARRKNHVLYFDNFLGLYQAGQSSNSSLSVADVLRTWIQKQHVRVVGEMTPERFHAFQERDRGLADLFQVVRVRETDEEQTLRICIANMRSLEAKYKCWFGLDVLPTVLEIQRRYLRETVVPGNACGFLQQLAAKNQRMSIHRGTVYNHFHAQTGMALFLLDHAKRLARSEVLEGLDKQVIGQRAALEAMADVVAIAKARLNETNRPLASFLFLGPTGVGKTQSAKALAEYLYSSSDRVLRFDMNEFVSPDAVARLVGTFDAPEGLLTSAVRRQPFSVVLFDEIEKAHPDVFDLLLQVTGEARLTDTLGRTTDFSNTIVILTSNLGSREASKSLGFGSQEQDRSRTYVRAAEEFFRPEFFNRLDRIVPFTHLRREEIAHIAQLLIRKVLNREGLVRRRCVLQVAPEALDKVVEAGYQPQLGARALKRTMENQLTRPLSARLAELVPTVPTLIRVFPGQSGLSVDVKGLEEVEQLPERTTATAKPLERLGKLQSVSHRIETDAEKLRPAGEMNVESVSGQHDHYFLLKDLCYKVTQQIEELLEQLERFEFDSLGRPSTVRRSRKSVYLNQNGSRRILHEITSAEDVGQFLDDLALNVRPKEDAVQSQLSEIEDELALAETVLHSQSQSDQVVLFLKPLLQTQHDQLNWLLWSLADTFCSLGLEAIYPHPERMEQMEAANYRMVTISGPHASSLVQREVGVHLFCLKDDTLFPVQLYAMAGMSSSDEAADAYHTQQQRWLERLAAGQATIDDDPHPIGKVLRVYSLGQRPSCFDLRTNLRLPRSERSAENFRSIILAGLPRPPELREGTA